MTGLGKISLFSLGKAKGRSRGLYGGRSWNIHGSAQWEVERQQTQFENTKDLITCKDFFSLIYGSGEILRGCPERFWNARPWTYSNLTRTEQLALDLH